MNRVTGHLMGAFALSVLVTLPATASPITFIGADPGADSLAAAPNSVAAAAAFDAAAALLGPMGLITFETAPLGGINNTDLGDGVTIDDLGSDWQISNISGGSGSLYGYNTTPGGQYFATSFSSSFVEGIIEFRFASPIQAFGAFLAGLQGVVAGQQTIVYTSGDTHTIDIPQMSGGTAFVGFTDAGASILAVRLNFGGDYVTVDDVRYGPISAQAVPEPASLVLVTLGLVGVAMRNRIRAARRVR